jgi:RNA polymerase sigma factor (sigma-70 family)
MGKGDAADMALDRSELAVALARLGQAEDLARLVGPRLFSHARRLADDAESARDVVQTAWVEILRGIKDLREDHAFLAWALRIVTRMATRGVGGLQRDRALAADWAVTHEREAAEPDHTPRDLARALASLAPPMRAALALFYLEDLSVAEVAIALEIPPGTVKTRLMHGREKLRAFLGEEYGQV